MKTCLIVFAVILAIILVLATALLVYVFAFEKELPQVAINQIKEELKGLGDAEVEVNFALIHDFGDVSCEYKLSYKPDKHEGKKIIMDRTGKDATFVMTYKEYDVDNNLAYDLKFYKDGEKYMYKNGEAEAAELTQNEWEAYVKAYFVAAMPLVEKEDKYVLAGGKVIEEELTTVKQKGFEITAIAGSQAGKLVTMTYNLKSSIISTYRIESAGDPYTEIKEYKLNLDYSKFSK